MASAPSLVVQITVAELFNDFSIVLRRSTITYLVSTLSLDFNDSYPRPLVEGEIVLITEDGAETHLRNPGDTVVQKGTMHAWRNPGASWARWVSVLISAEPSVVNGRVLHPEFHQPQLYPRTVRPTMLFSPARVRCLMNNVLNDMLLEVDKQAPVY